MAQSYADALFDDWYSSGGAGIGFNPSRGVTALENTAKESPAPAPAPVVDPAVLAQQKLIAETQAAIDGILKNISALDTGYANTKGNIGTDYTNLIERYNDDMRVNEGKYSDQVASNEGTRDRNRHLGLVAAAQGGRGLASSLGSIGAYDESAQRLANRAVAQSANMDLGEADRTFDTNAKQLSTAWGDLKRDDERRRTDANNARQSQLDQAQYDYDQQRAGLYSDLAGHYSTRNDTANASKYTGQAHDITADSVRRARPAAQQYARTDLNYNAGQLANYLAGQNDMSVSMAGGAPMAGAPQLFANTRQRERDERL